MQETLEEFLNFSRPLVPLSQKHVDLVELCRETAALHRGMAAERDIVIIMEAASAVPVTCDDRKVGKILINLIQNAIEVSPPVTAIRLLVDRKRRGRVRVRVIDQGPGLGEEIADRIFERTT